MIRNLLATTAIATLLASGAYAQDTTTDPAMAPSGGMTDGATAPVEEAVEPADGHLASNLIGENVYNGTQDDAENIGSVKDIVIGLDGQAQMIVVGVGGFLGIGQKDIAVPYGEVEWAQREDGSTWLVVNASRESLEQQEEFNADAYEPALVVGSSQGEDAAGGGASEDMAADEGATTEEGATEDMAAEEGAASEDGTTEEMVAVEDAPAEEDASGDMAADEGATTEEGASGDMAASEDSSTDQGASGDMAASGDSSTDQGASDDMAASDSASTEESASGDMAATDGSSSEDMAADEGATTEEGASEDMAATEGDAAATDDTATAAIDPASLSEVDSANLSAEQLIGTTVYGADEENVGEISDVILSEDGNVEAVTMDVGGFLGIGEKQVAVSMENLAFMSDESDELYLYTSFTQEQLEAQPEYDEATFAEQRDEQLLMNEMN